MECPNCNNTNIQADATKCGECGSVFKDYEESAPEGVTGLASKSNNQNVTVTDIKMPFGSMVEFMVKWAIASIPAFIILLVIGFTIAGILGVGAVSLFK